MTVCQLPLFFFFSELHLLDALLQKGEGNWEEISRGLLNKTAAECQSHYENFYLNNNDVFPNVSVVVGDRHDQPVIFAPRDVSTDVPRPLKTTNLHKELAGTYFRIFRVGPPFKLM